MHLKDKGSAEYRRVMRETEGNGRDEARKASWEVTGGGLSKLWDDLCNAGHIICLVVRCPRCDDAEEMYTMQKNLKRLICMIDKRLADQCIDTFTSRKDIGTVGGTTAICRWPIYLGTAVKTLEPP